MNPRLLLRHFENRGVVFTIRGDKLIVGFPSDLLADDDIASLIENKADILEVLKRREEKLQVASERGFIATYSKEPGYVALHDPLTGEWHEFPASSCLPSVVEDAKARSRRRKEGRSA